MDNNNIITIDNGSSMIKAGYSGENSPRSIFPSVVGRLSKPSLFGNSKNKGIGQKDTYVGDEALFSGNFNFPIKRGIVTNWDDMERIWGQVFYNELRIEPKEYSVFLTESLFNPIEKREKTTEIMFEKFGVRSIFLSISDILPLYANGIETGISISSGYEKTNIVPVFKGKIIRDAITSINLGGNDITLFKSKLLKDQKNCELLTTAKLQIVNDIKEKFGYVSLNYELDLLESKKNSKSFQKSYTLPDNQNITIDRECFQCTEPLFQPSMIGIESEGIQNLTFNSIMKCNYEIRNDMFSNIVLSGRNTEFPGLKERLTKELINLSPSNTELNIMGSNPKYSQWIGGSIYSSILNEDQWVSKLDYNENGSNIINSKCA